MKDIASKCIAVTLQAEGGAAFSNDPDDFGGMTKFGISDMADGIRDGNYRGISIEHMTEDEAISIYRENYWVPMRLWRIDDPEMKLQLFDMGVNAGIRTAVKIIQRHLGLKEDGIIGPITAKTVNFGFSVNGYKQLRKDYYTNLAWDKPKLKKYLQGWLNRVDRVHL